MIGAAACWAGGAGAAELVVSLRAADGPVAHAVVELLEPGAPAPTPSPAVMDQVNSEFVPRQLIVTRGSPVSFPNSDSTRHQVYSFSAAKRFELPLYAGTPPDPVVFDKAGLVTLGCNIHDAMIGFIVVVETERYAVSNAEGVARLADLPAGAYRLRIWHERQAGEPLLHSVELPEDAQESVSLELSLKPPRPPRGDERLRALQERFRALDRERD
ncbi:methylamine utilization protein [Pseudomarimonas salicorniae]|uniref:Methylamine utilization protein n=1 Tax=Pseudomarimonas salicorniae TaxID=2933270 RepID=A0ABT0GJF3_9GAMM|nr:methylamine utilization protein [Lysobacter sp. CAU 1642]MCK7594682.1 methylamine utilization protein [Lysobacter sp. CAU 1642]